MLSTGIHPVMLITAISIHFCKDSSESLSRVDRAPAASGEEGDRSVKSDLQFAIPHGGLHGINITPKSQLSKSHSGVGHSISQRQLKPELKVHQGAGWEAAANDCFHYP